jgi:hypothetical protein
VVNLIVHQNLECSTFYFHILGGDSLFYRIHYKLLLQDKRTSPDSSFSAPASSEGHSASDARISSGSSWCAPVSDDKHYLQVDLGRLYDLNRLVTYGDSTSPKWVATYNVNYTTDLLNWKTVDWVRTKVITNNNNIIVCFYLAYCCDFSLLTMNLSLFLFVDSSRKQECLRLCILDGICLCLCKGFTIYSIDIRRSTMYES